MTCSFPQAVSVDLSVWLNSVCRGQAKFGDILCFAEQMVSGPQTHNCWVYVGFVDNNTTEEN